MKEIKSYIILLFIVLSAIAGIFKDDAVQTILSIMLLPMAIKYVSLSKEDFKMDNTDTYFDLFQYVFEEYNIDIPEEQEESFLIFLKSYNINIEYERIDFGDGKSITKSKINKNDLYQVVILYKIYLKKLKYNLLKELNKKGE